MPMQKIFISHDLTDTSIVREFVDFLESIGIDNNLIFCSSLDASGILSRSNFFEKIKKEPNNNVLAFFILTENYFKNPLCMFEMGGIWIKTNYHIPVIVPPFSSQSLQGVIQQTQEIIINESKSLNSLFDEIFHKSEITPPSFNSWERKRDKFIKNINKLVLKEDTRGTLSRDYEVTKFNSNNDLEDSSSKTFRLRHRLQKETKETALLANYAEKESNETFYSPNFPSEEKQETSSTHSHGFHREFDIPVNSTDGETERISTEPPFIYSQFLKYGETAVKEEKTFDYTNPNDLLKFMTTKFNSNQWISFDELQQKIEEDESFYTWVSILELHKVLDILKREKMIISKTTNFFIVGKPIYRFKLLKEAYTNTRDLDEQADRLLEWWEVSFRKK
ncbi:hypothetical protein Q0O85_19365 [Priestia megaterium]|uniref:hypothetical protein n=1 Tax=Priestia megaterium TaxID=1404 RepID=UPI00345AA817